MGLGIGGGIDQILENSGRDPIFMPFLGNTLNKIIGSNETVESGYKRRREAYKELLKLDKSEKLLLEDKESLDKLIQSEFLSEKDKNLLAKGFLDDLQKVKNQRHTILSDINKELNVVNTVTTELESKNPFETKKNK
jgi:hypothetical protein